MRWRKICECVCKNVTDKVRLEETCQDLLTEVNLKHLPIVTGSIISVTILTDRPL